MSALPPSIVRQILAEGGSVPFARFMELALTDPDAGYYTRGPGFLGEKGDFTTAPRRVPAFNRAVARFLADLIDVIPTGPVTVVEVGAGEGDLGAGVLDWWETTRPDLRDRVTYLVDDVAETSRRRQAAALGRAAAAQWRTGIWEDERAAGTGIVVSNELFDALAVHLVDLRGETPLEAWVEVDEAPEGQALATEVWKDLSPAAARELEVITAGCSLEEARALTAAGLLELRPAGRTLLERWAGRHEDLAVLTIDYGDWLAGPGAGLPPAAPGDQAGVTRLSGDLHRRSLRGYYRHQVTHDPYCHVGRQDLTADVDFRALALHGEALGFETVLFTTLADFLRAAGAGEDLRSGSRAGEGYSLEIDAEDAPLAALLDPGGLGGWFKVMLQVRESEDS